MGVNTTGPTQIVLRLVFIICWIAFYCLDAVLVAQEISQGARTNYQHALNTNNSEEKIRLLQRAVNLSPQFVDARLELAKTLIEIAQYRNALTHLNYALSVDRGNAYVWFEKGRAHANLAEHNDALKCFERAIKKKKDVPEFHLHLGKAYYQIELFNKALDSFERALSIAISNQNKSQQAGTWYWMGRVQQAKNDTEDALDYYRRALQLEPEHREAKIYLAKLEEQLMLASLYQEAEVFFEQKKLQKVKEILQSIITIDSTYRDVSKKLTRVEKQIEAEKRIARKETKILKPETQLNNVDSLDILAKQPQDSIQESDVSRTEPGEQSHNVPSTAKTKKRGVPASMIWISGGGVLIVLAAFLFVFYKRKIQTGARTLKVRPIPAITGNEPTTIVIPKNMLQNEFDRYRIETELGRGGMGQVFKAYDIKLERPVALKIITVDQAMGKDAIKDRILRFRREAKATASLNHPNIVSLYDYAEKNGVFYMTMEYIDGASVQELLRKHKHLKVTQAVKIVSESCLALEYAHRQKLIHRDIKPSNIMLSQEGRVKILDFGVAKMLNLTSTQAYTMTGMRLGSPSYMSPEQINAGILDGRSDIFALGVVFYEILTGQKPFKINEEHSLGQLFAVILNTQPPKPSSIRKGLPANLDAIVETMVAKDPEKRFQNASEVIDELKSLDATTR